MYYISKNETIHYLDSNNQCKKCSGNCVTCDDKTGICKKCISDDYEINTTTGKCEKKKPSGLLYGYIGGGVLLSCLLICCIKMVGK